MKIRGVNYDIGIDFDEANSRPAFDPIIAQRELQIIRNDLHCNAVRISGSNIDRLCSAADMAAAAGLQVWLSPHLGELSEDETIAGMLACAKHAEALRQHGHEVVFIAGCELTLFMPGLLPGYTLMQRILGPTFAESVRTGAHNPRLNAFLRREVAAIREVFDGKITYASAPIEAVEWSLFDFVGIDHYREARNKTIYGDRAKAAGLHGKPVIATEVGCCTFRGAEEKGAWGWSVLDQGAPFRRVTPGLVRDEDLQAEELVELLGLLSDADVAGVFVFTFVAPTMFHTADPVHDLDMACYGLVKSYPDRFGTVYDGVPWDPKASFKAVGKLYQRWSEDSEAAAGRRFEPTR